MELSSVVDGEVKGEQGDVSKGEHFEDEVGVLCKSESEG